MTSTIPSTELHTLRGHVGPVATVKYNGDGNYCVSGGNDRTLKLWNPNKGTLIKTYTGHGWEVLDLDIAHDNSRIVSCGGDRLVFLWDVATGRMIKKFRGHTSRVNTTSFDKIGDVVVTGGYDKTVRIWDCKSHSTDPIQVMEEAKDSISCVHVTEFEIIASSIDGHIRNYDIRYGKLKTDSLLHPVTSVKVSHDGKCLLGSCLDSTIRLIDKEEGELLNEYKGHKNTQYKVDSCFSNDDAYIFSGSEDNSIYVWDLVEAKILAKLRGHSKPVVGLCYHPKEDRLLSSSGDGTIKVWKT